MTDTYQFHEVASIFPMMSEDEFEDLKRDIAQNGLKEPIWLYEDKIIDGRNRYNACRAVEVKPSFRKWEGGSSLVSFVVALNLNRRHLDASARAFVGYKIKPLYEKEAAERRRATQNNDAAKAIPDTEKVSASGDKGESRIKASKAAHTNQVYMGYIETLHRDAPDLYEAAESRSITLKDAMKELECRRKAARLQALHRKASTAPKNETLQVWHGDFRKLSARIADNSVDLILTDPPYPREYLPLWTPLAEMAARVLKPGGFLVSYSGQLYLPEVMSRLVEHLEYYWLAGLSHPGNQAQRFERKVQNAFKPIVIFNKPPQTKQSQWFIDLVTSPKADKDSHEWGQSVAPFEYLLDRFSEPGALVVDPFAGGGTTLVACKNKLRRCIGIEIDEAHVNTARGRIAE